MKLPADFLELVSTGAAELRALAAQLRVRAAAQPNAPELWLSVRDYEGLAGRLADSDEWAWRTGFAGILISGQDFGVLDELLARLDDSPILPSEEQASVLTRLRRFLCQYYEGEFEFDEPAA
jgi:hypothetical protein